MCFPLQKAFHLNALLSILLTSFLVFLFLIPLRTIWLPMRLRKLNPTPTTSQCIHIQPSFSPCASPAFIIPKKESGEWRLVTDYRALNKITVKNRYPLPRIEDLLDQLKGEKYFTKMDLTMGYHQVCMAATDTWKTTFKTIFGLYEWMVMPFGLTNAPATFQRLINDIFVLCWAALWSSIWMTFWSSVRLGRNTYNMCATYSNCCVPITFRSRNASPPLAITFVSYLGFVIDQEGVCPDASKVQALAQWPAPQSMLALKSFLGGINFYRKFIPHFSQLAKPLHHLANQSTFLWTLVAQE
jgi:hypothetical protein